MSKRKLSRQQAWRVEKIQAERARRAAKRESDAEQALAAGHEVAALDDLSNGKRENLPEGVPLTVELDSAVLDVEAESMTGKKIIYSISAGNIYGEFDIVFDLGQYSSTRLLLLNLYLT